ncbi:MAG: PseG/SpsG family protein, partial [Candidatus Sulfotelmatobacter sp.]
MGIGTLLVRADASVAIGTGHVMRCLALAQAWQDAGGQAVFASAKITDALRKRLAAESCDVAAISSPGGSFEDAAQTVALARENKCDWVVVDGYAFGPQYQQVLKAAGLKTLFVDDHGHAPPYSADVVLNQNLTATRELYSDREGQTRLLLGTRYCLLRREFADWREWQREISPVCRRLLVVMGGSDPENVTARVLEVLAADEFEG